jgi:5-methyltetrahydrofolate--homocysteine methyltransferase
MDALIAGRRGEAPPLAEDPKAAERRERRERTKRIVAARAARAGADGDGGADAPPEPAGRSDVATDNPVPTPPFWGARVAKGMPLADYSAFLDERATFLGQWGLRGARGGKGPSYEELVETEGRPRLRMWLDRIQAEQIMEPAVAYGYFPCVSKGDDLIILNESGSERTRFTFPRQRRDRRLCLADFFRSEDSGQVDVIAFAVVTMGRRVSEVTGELFAANSYRDYLELHGLSVQLTEALAEYWHKRIRSELVMPGGGTAGDEDPTDVTEFFDLGFRGARYSFGYPACPDLEQQVPVLRMLNAERIGVVLSEEFQLEPEQSTSALVVHHPEAKYFAAR